MSDSTPFIDEFGVRRDQPQLPQRHMIDTANWGVLSLIAAIDEPGTRTRLGWENLLRVHGFPAVLRATARCFERNERSGLVTNEQAQAVLDGKLPDGHPIRRSKNTLS